MIRFSDPHSSCFFLFNGAAATDIYTLSLHDALPISGPVLFAFAARTASRSEQPLPPLFSSAVVVTSIVAASARPGRSEEHTSELQSLRHLVCRLLLEKKK